MQRRWFRPLLALAGGIACYQPILLAFPAPAGGTILLAQKEKSKPAEMKRDESGVFVDGQDLDVDDTDELMSNNERSGTERISNSYSLQLGAGYRKGLGLELELGYHLDEDRLIEIRYGQFSAEDIDGFSKLDLQSLIVQSKIFISNSLYFTVGAGWTGIKATGSESLAGTSGGLEDYAYSGKVSQGLLAIATGNQWQEGTWTWGVDWLKLSLPFSVSLNSSKIESEGTSVDLRRIKNENELKTESWSIDFGMTAYAGYVF